MFKPESFYTLNSEISYITTLFDT